MTEQKTFIFKDGFIQEYDKLQNTYFTINPSVICEILNDYYSSKSLPKIDKECKNWLLDIIDDKFNLLYKKQEIPKKWCDAIKIIESLECE